MLQALLEGKGDVDGLVLGLAALFAHHYGDALDHLLAFVRAHPRYVLPLFVVALVRHESVQTYAATTCNHLKLGAFVNAMRTELERLLCNEISVDGFNRAARDIWNIS